MCFSTLHLVCELWLPVCTPGEECAWVANPTWFGGSVHLSINLERSVLGCVNPPVLSQQALTTLVQTWRGVNQGELILRVVCHLQR